MSRIAIPNSIEESPAESQPLLEAVARKLGTVPNLFRLAGTSPAVLRGFLDLEGALAGGKIAVATRERIALTVAEINGCDYCLAAHAFVGKRLGKLTDEEIEAGRKGAAADPKVAAALRFATAVVTHRGQVSSAAMSELQGAGYEDAEVVEIVALVALNTLTNYLNVVAQTDVDFPAIASSKVA